MNSKIIIYTTLFFLLISFFFLSVVGQGQKETSGDNVWMLYFNDPKSRSLDFGVENHSQNTLFHWEIFVEKNKTHEGDFSIAKDEVKIIPVSTIDMGGKKITIIVTGGEEKKEIYKKL